MIHITLSTAYTGSMIMTFPTNFPPSTYFDQLNCMIGSGGGTNTVTQPSNAFKPYPTAAYDPAHGRFNEWTVVPGPGILSFRDPLLTASGEPRRREPVDQARQGRRKESRRYHPATRAHGRGEGGLKATGSIKIALTITYTPTGGKPNTKTVKLTLRQKK